MILEATHTHLYPGHKGRISGLQRIADIGSGRDCLIEFSDGSAASARIAPGEHGWLLQANAYRTAAGTDIAEKRWYVRLEEDGDQLGFRILKKTQSQ